MKKSEVHKLEKKKKPGLKFNPWLKFNSGLALTGVRTTELSRTFTDNHLFTKETFFVPKVAVVERFEWIHKLKKPNQTKDTQITNGLIHLLAQRGGKTFRWCLTWENVSLVPNWGEIGGWWQQTREMCRWKIWRREIWPLVQSAGKGVDGAKRVSRVAKTLNKRRQSKGANRSY